MRVRASAFSAPQKHQRHQQKDDWIDSTNFGGPHARAIDRFVPRSREFLCSSLCVDRLFHQTSSRWRADCGERFRSRCANPVPAASRLQPHDRPVHLSTGDERNELPAAVPVPAGHGFGSQRTVHLPAGYDSGELSEASLPTGNGHERSRAMRLPARCGGAELSAAAAMSARRDPQFRWALHAGTLSAWRSPQFRRTLHAGTVSARRSPQFRRTLRAGTLSTRRDPQFRRTLRQSLPTGHDGQSVERTVRLALSCRDGDECRRTMRLPAEHPGQLRPATLPAGNGAQRRWTLCQSLPARHNNQSADGTVRLSAWNSARFWWSVRA